MASIDKPGKRTNGEKRRQGMRSLQDLEVVGNQMISAMRKNSESSASPSISTIEINPESDAAPQLQAALDPKYSELRARFERRKIPLELMDYALGLLAAPSKDSSGSYANNFDAHIAESLKKHNEDIGRSLSLAYEAHLRRLKADDEYRQEWESIGKAWEERDLAKTLDALPSELHDYARGVAEIPDSPEGAHIRASLAQARFRPFVTVPILPEDSRGTKDLPPMPSDIRDRIAEYPAAVNYAIIMFTRQLRDGEYENDTHQKFARYFAEEVEEKAFRQNPSARDRSRYENAYWALLSLKVVDEKWSAEGRKRFPEVHIRSDETERQIGYFLTFEKIRRLESKLSDASDTDRTTITADLQALRTSPEYQSARSRHYNGNVSREVLQDPAQFETARQATIFEALGNRLYVSTRTLPIESEDLSSALEESQIERSGKEEGAHLPNELRFKHRILGRFISNSDMESSSASRDVDTMMEYLVADGSWNDSVQEGFDIIIKGISSSLRSLSQQKDTVTAALDTPKISDAAIQIFKKHSSNIARLEKSIRDTQTKLLTLWHDYSDIAKNNPVRLEAQRAKQLEAQLENHVQRIRQLEETVTALESEKSDLADEADDHLSSLEILRPKIADIIEHTSDMHAKTRLQAAVKVMDEYLAIPSEARQLKNK